MSLTPEAREFFVLAGRRGGKKGAVALNAKLSAKQKSARGRKAARARWKKAKGKTS